MRATYDSLTHPLRADSERRWRVAVNGAQLSSALHVVLDHPSFGTLTYGMTAAGYDGWTFHEPGGGGSVILPFAQVEGELFVGLIEQNRPHQGGRVLQAPRGFADRGEDHARTARRELFEEMGLEADALVLLPGSPANPNSTFFETVPPDEGVHFFALEVPSASLAGEGDRRTFRSHALSSNPAARRERLAEQIGAAVFLPWYEAAIVGDMFTNAAVARLLAARRAPVGSCVGSQRAAVATGSGSPGR